METSNSFDRNLYWIIPAVLLVSLMGVIIFIICSFFKNIKTCLGFQDPENQTPNTSLNCEPENPNHAPARFSFENETFTRPETSNNQNRNERITRPETTLNNRNRNESCARPETLNNRIRNERNESRSAPNKIVEKLFIKRIEKQNFRLPIKAVRRHCPSLQMDEEKASENSGKRGEHFARTVQRNTVFARPKVFHLCSTLTDEKLIVSSRPVKTYLSVYSSNSKTWSSSFEGNYFAVFQYKQNSSNKDVAHFSKILYKQVVWPQIEDV